MRGQPFGNARGVCHTLRSQNYQQAIAIGIFDRDFQRAGISLRIGIAKDVNRVVVAPMRWENSVECVHGFLRNRSDSSSRRDQSVRGQNRGAARIRQDCQPRSVRARLLAENFRHVKQVRNVLHSQMHRTGGMQHRRPHRCPSARPYASLRRAMPLPNAPP